MFTVLQNIVNHKMVKFKYTVINEKHMLVKKTDITKSIRLNLLF